MSHLDQPRKYAPPVQMRRMTSREVIRYGLLSAIWLLLLTPALDYVFNGSIDVFSCTIRALFLALGITLGFKFFGKIEVKP